MLRSYTPNAPELERGVDRNLHWVEIGKGATNVESGFCRGVWITKSVLVNRHTVDLVYLGSPTFPICLLPSISISY